MGGRLKQVVLRLLGRRGAERAFLVKTLVLHYANEQWRRVTQGPAPRSVSVAPLRGYSDPGGQTFFGYYDITPFSKNNGLLLGLVAPTHNAPPRPGESVSVGYFELGSDAGFRRIGETSTWCWQQGCRLQWFPGDEDRLVIYNKLVDGRYGSVIQDARTGTIEREYQGPVYSLERGGRWAVYPNFSRLNRLRPGYGYVDLPDRTRGDDAPAEDGIFLLDLETGSTELLVSLRELAALEPSPSMAGAQHYVNHLCFNPAGDTFLFFHLWASDSGSHARLLTCDRASGGLTIVEDRGEVSHYAWKDRRRILGTFLYPNKVARYQLYGGQPREYATLLGDTLTRDGHPSYSPDGSMVLTDTYADHRGMQRLLLVDAREELRELGRFHSPINIRVRHHGEAKCDLHPRWDRQGRYVCFDSAHSGTRALYVMDLGAVAGGVAALPASHGHLQ
jgi:hypothetical protein